MRKANTAVRASSLSIISVSASSPRWADLPASPWPSTMDNEVVSLVLAVAASSASVLFHGRWG